MTEIDVPFEAASPAEIVAYAGRYYRNARYIMALVCFACAAWFAYDGWVGWPNENDLYDQAMARHEKPAHSKHLETDLALQKALGLSLPFAGLAILAWLLFNSRGSYRLAGDTLHVPGHPPIPLDAIREIDKTKWEKKGIAFLDYELENAAGKLISGTAVLDDFVYQRGPTDEIVAAIEAKLAPVELNSVTTAAASTETPLDVAPAAEEGTSE